ncbi:hypothetical protein VNO80_19956 [Phaseolus coccineus]|uniref:Bifunctional inhibitor/plant lipid transfer protein/seed storage helical domain-containing protein n=1 Tax=Phaseolus coccineus TaxID=3886 RepID=A0AAN9MHE6_PHACN
MGSKGSVFVALFLSLNLLSLSIVTSQISLTCSVDLSQVSACSGLLTGEPASPAECCKALMAMGVSDPTVCVTDAIIAGLMRTPIPNGVSVNITLDPCGIVF